MTTKLSEKVIKDLRIELESLYGADLQKSLSDEDLNEIGIFLLTALAEGLKMKMSKSVK